MEICTPDASVEYEFYNAIYNSKLGETGKLKPTKKIMSKILKIHI